MNIDDIILEKDLTYDQGKERQLRWKITLSKEPSYYGMPIKDISDTDLLNWLSMNFTIIRKISSIQEI